MSEAAPNQSEVRLIDGKEYRVIQLPPDEKVIQEARQEERTAGTLGSAIMADVCTGFEAHGARWVRKAPILPVTGGRKERKEL